MKRILFIAPHAFPIRSSESICNAKVAYTLANAGYIVDVYTCNDNSTYPADEELTKILSSPSNLTIRTVKPDYIISRKSSIKKLIRDIHYNVKILLSTGFFYNGISIPRIILKHIEENIKANGGFCYDLIITRGFNTDLAAVTLARKYGVKWIANWNDPFPCVKFPAPYGKGHDAKLPYFENRMYKAIQRWATIHTFPNDRLRDYMLKCFTNVQEERTAIIPHMALSSLSKLHTQKHNKLEFIHCGDLKAPRSPRTFIQAIYRYLSDKPEDRSLVQCSLIGGVDNDTIDLIRTLKLDDVITHNKGLNYKNALNRISDATISLIIEADCEEGIYLPTKVVDAIQCGTPIFAISPKIGVLHDYIDKYPIGYYANNTSVDSIYSQLCLMFADFKANKLPKISPTACPDVFENAILEKFNRIIGG